MLEKALRKGHAWEIKVILIGGERSHLGFLYEWIPNSSVFIFIVLID